MHIVPASSNDLPNHRKRYAFDDLDFNFAEYGARFDGKCRAEALLPDCEIAQIRIGQFVSGEDWLWGVELLAGE